MSTLQYVLGIVASVLTLALVVEMLRRRRLRERHAIWWLVAGMLALFISVFPQSLEWAAGLLGFDAPVNLAFFASLILLFLVALQHSAELRFEIRKFFTSLHHKQSLMGPGQAPTPPTR